MLRFDSIQQKRVVTKLATPFKRILLLLNIVFLIVSLLVTGIGILALIKLYHLAPGLPVCVIGLGSLVFFLTIFGSWGAARNNKRVLLVYFVLLLLIVIGEIVVGFIGLQNKSNVKDPLQRAWNSSSDNERNSLQAQLKCCGFLDVDDQPGSNCNGTDSDEPTPSASSSSLSPSISLSPLPSLSQSSSQSPPPPPSPSPSPSPSQSPSPSISPSISPPSQFPPILKKRIKANQLRKYSRYHVSCFNKLSSLWEDNMVLIAIVGVVFAVLQAIGLLFSLILYFCIVCSSQDVEEIDPYKYDDLSMKSLTAYEDEDEE